MANNKLYIYGYSSAACFEFTMNKDKSTINIDVAPKPDNVTVSWSDKITFQLTDSELVEVAGVFLGLAPSCKCARADKGISFERQPGKVFVSASAGSGKIYGLPFGVGDCYQVADFFLTRLKQGSTSHDTASILASLRSALALNRLEQ